MDSAPESPAQLAPSGPLPPREGPVLSPVATPRTSLARRTLDGARDFLRRLYHKANEDNIFFMAGAIAFNVLVAIVPLLLAVVGIAGTILKQTEADATDPLIQYLVKNLPPVGPEFIGFVRELLRGLIDKSAGFVGIGTVLLAWLATRLIGTLRTALREVFNIQRDRGIIGGKLFDLKMVLAAGTLFALNVGVTIVLGIVADFGFGAIGLGPRPLGALDLLYGNLVAFLSIWVMFLLIYRYLPAGGIQWRTAGIAASFTAVTFELLKLAFSWYVTTIANYTTTYGNLATLVILVLWVYYSSVAFILGGEVAQVVAIQRIRRRQKERLR